MPCCKGPSDVIRHVVGSVSGAPCTIALRHAPPICVGIAGGIAAGRARCVACFLRWGWRWDADRAAKSLYRTDHGLREDVVGHLRRSSFEMTKAPRWTSTGRRWPRKCLGSPTNLPGWNREFTPRWPAFDTWLGGQRACTWVVREAAILFELAATKVATPVTVEAPAALREARALRRGTSPEDVARRMNVQWPSEDRIARAQVTIWNDGVRPLLPQVEQLRDTVERWAAWRGQVD